MLALRDDKDVPSALDDDAIMDDVIVDIASPNIIGHIMGESYYVGPLLSFDILLRSVSHSDVAISFSYMDLSIFEYSPVSFIDDIDVMYLIHPHHKFMILMMSLCSLILMTVTSITPIIALLMSEFHLLLMTLRQLTLV